MNYLKDDLAEKADFEFVPEKLWLKLVQEYSTASDLEAQRIMLKSYENSLQFDSVPKVCGCFGKFRWQFCKTLVELPETFDGTAPTLI